jgi:molybdopterin-synthase adenylyltransferase
MAAGGRPEAEAVWPPLRPASYRLKRSIELFSASDGSLYLLRSGAHDDFVLPEVSQGDRLILQRLSGGFADQAELRQILHQHGLASDELGRSLAQLEQLGLAERSTDESLLSDQQAERYDRQLVYLADLAQPGVPGEQLQRQLLEAQVMLLGCGGLGSWTACGLVCAGVGSLVLVDDDRVELSNLNRQLLFTEADLGGLKVVAAAEALMANNSELKVNPIERRIRGVEDLGELLDGVDLLISTADWPPYQLARWVNQACLPAGVPYLTAGQFPPLIRVGPLVVPGRSACLECLEQQTRHNYPLYDELAHFRAGNPSLAATLGAASGLVGSMLAMESIHLLTEACRPASLDCALVVDLRTMTLTREEITRDPDCPACHPGATAPTDSALTDPARRCR